MCGPVATPVARPYLLFPSTLAGENRVEMALNYTDPIEFATLRSGATCANATAFLVGHSLYCYSSPFVIYPFLDSNDFSQRKRARKFCLFTLRDIFWGSFKLKIGGFVGGIGFFF